MKKQNLKITFLALATFAAAGMTVSAQTNNSAYFLEGSTFRHELNPSFVNERDYVSFPILGNLNQTIRTNSGIGDFLYVRPDGTLTTFLSDAVTRSEFLNGLSERSRFNLSVNLSILSYGFHAFGGFNTISLNLKSDSRVAIPREFFSFMKDGLGYENAAYHISNMNVSTTNYAELALGHARQLNDQWSVGAKVKLLMGLAKADFQVNDMEITATPDHWTIRPNDVNGHISIGGVNMKTKGELNKYTEDDYIKDEFGNSTGQLKDGVSDEVSFDDLDFDDIGLSGFGLGFDLGASYRLNDDWNFSAAILDLGFISWTNTNHLAMKNEFDFKGFENISMEGDDDPNSFNNQLDRLEDDLKDLARFKKEGLGGYTRALAATLNIGAQYTLPAYRPLTFGALSSTRINGSNSWTEMRLSANVAPIDWFEASVNYGLSSFGSDMGFMLNFHPRYFNFFVATNIPFTRLEPAYFVPIGRANLNINFGIAIPFGEKL